MLDAAGIFERDLSDGLADYERAILARWDGGEDCDAIAATLGIGRTSVAHVVRLYDDRPDPDPRRKLAAVNAEFVARLGAETRRSQERARVRQRREAAMRDRMIEVGEINDMLTDRIESLAAELLPNGRRQGHEWVTSNLADEATGTTSLRVHIGGGSKRGWWRDFATHDKKGDALKLVAEVLFRGEVKPAVQWAKSWLHLDDLDPGRLRQHRLEARARADDRARQAEAERKRTRDSARRRWHQARRLERGDPVCRYLAGRGIDLSALGKAPGALRYHPGLAYGYKGPEVPAMVAMAVDLTGAHRATHRTWIAPDGSAKAGPALIGFDDKTGAPNDPKKVMGSPLGCHIPLWKGTHDCTLRDIPAGTDVYVSEGIEDGLTAAAADPSIRVICMIALGYLSALELPEQMGALIILKQNDPPDSDAARMLTRAVAAHRAAGRRVLFVAPPAGAKDLNELATRGAA